MNCPKCDKEVYRYTIYYEKDGKKVEGCPHCINISYGFNLITTALDKSLGSPAHRDDIKRRKVDIKSGEVYRDYGKKSFTSNWSSTK